MKDWTYRDNVYKCTLFPRKFFAEMGELGVANWDKRKVGLWVLVCRDLNSCQYDVQDTTVMFKCNLNLKLLLLVSVLCPLENSFVLRLW